MKPQENKSQFALLGFLAIQPYSGYAIKTMIENSTEFFWKEGYGQIYPNLKKLVKSGLAKVEEVDQENRPLKKVYEITARGKKALKEWLGQPVEIRHIRSEMLLKIFFGGFSPPEISIKHLESELQTEETLLKKYLMIKKQLEACDPSAHIQYSLLTLDYGTLQAKQNIDWCKKSIAALKK